MQKVSYKKLRQLMHDLGISIDDLEKKDVFTRETLKWFTNQDVFAADHTVERIARAFGVDSHEFLVPVRPDRIIESGFIRTNKGYVKFSAVDFFQVEQKTLSAHVGGWLLPVGKFEDNEQAWQYLNELILEAGRLERDK